MNKSMVSPLFMTHGVAAAAAAAVDMLVGRIQRTDTQTDNYLHKRSLRYDDDMIPELTNIIIGLLCLNYLNPRLWCDVRAVGRNRQMAYTVKPDNSISSRTFCH